MAQPVWNNSTKHYSFAEKTNPKDRIEVEVGDAEDPNDFHPQFKIKRWDNEVNASFRLLYGSIPGSISFSDDGTVVTWSKGQWSAKFYHIDGNEGSFEFEIHIPSVPPINYLEFSVNDKELDWLYQPALTQQEIDNGVVRPDNVVGSYAVYHKTKGRINDSAGMEYKAGKAFHVYRPHVVDDNNNETWGELSLAAGVLTVSVDQTWLDNAVYPVIVDPTFGYTTLGGTAQIITAALTNDQSQRVGINFTPPSDGTLDFISAGLRSLSGTEIVDNTAFVNVEDTDTDSHDETASSERLGLSVVTAHTWYNFTLSSEAIFSSNSYILSVVGNGEDITAGNIGLVGDSGGSGNRYEQDETGAGSYAANKDDPWLDAEGTNISNHSIYATYSTGDRGLAVNRVLASGRTLAVSRGQASGRTLTA